MSALKWKNTLFQSTTALRDVGVEFSVGVGTDDPIKDVVDGSTQVDDVEEEQRRETVESEDSGSANSDLDVIEKTVKKSKKLRNLFSFRKKEKVV